MAVRLLRNLFQTNLRISAPSPRTFATYPKKEEPIVAARGNLEDLKGPLLDFFPPKNIYDDVSIGRAWMARDLRIKSFEELHKVKKI
jgi:hypothetical protein